MEEVILKVKNLLLVKGSAKEPEEEEEEEVDELSRGRLR
jgi:hypothetical protein